MNWTKINKTEEISELTHLGKTYMEIEKSLNKGERIATYFELQELRNQNKLPKEFWAFVPNPDEISKDSGYVAWFYADSGGAGLDCGWDASDTGSSLGVFLIRKIVKKKVCKCCGEEL